jgi:hypothetical protein
VLKVLSDRVLINVFGHVGRKYQEAEENCIRSFSFVLLAESYYACHIEGGIGRECGTYREVEGCMQAFSGET